MALREPLGAPRRLRTGLSVRNGGAGGRRSSRATRGVCEEAQLPPGGVGPHPHVQAQDALPSRSAPHIRVLQTGSDAGPRSVTTVICNMPTDTHSFPLTQQSGEGTAGTFQLALLSQGRLLCPGHCRQRGMSTGGGAQTRATGTGQGADREDQKKLPELWMGGSKRQGRVFPPAGIARTRRDPHHSASMEGPDCTTGTGSCVYVGTLPSQRSGQDKYNPHISVTLERSALNTTGDTLPSL